MKASKLLQVVFFVITSILNRGDFHDTDDSNEVLRSCDALRAVAGGDSLMENDLEGSFSYTPLGYGSQSLR